jgi:putative peptide zinc metalloprotease protein
MAEPQAAPSDLSAKLGDVRASVRPNLDISRHVFNGKPTYVVRDPVTAQTHRFSAQDYQLFISVDQTRTLKESVEMLIAKKRITTEQTDDFYRFVVHLHQMGLLTLPLSDGSTLYNRYKQRMDAQKKGRFLKLMFMKVPLAQPDKWLGTTKHIVAPLFTITAFWIWLACLCVCGFILLVNWQEFVNPLGTMLTLSNVPILWVLLVGLKTFHELGHAYACKRFGGTVPEMGAMIMMGTPCAYVDASSSWSFPNRWHRMTVALAGMYFESMLAMVAVVVWLCTETGQLHSAAQYAIVLSTVVTIGFNANPLMRYDGYFILSDLVNIPNLHRDAKSAASGLIKWVLYGLKPKAVTTSRSVQVAMTVFGLACMIYGVTVAIGIATLLILAVPIVGPVIAFFVSGLPVVRLIQKWVMYVASSKELESVRMRAVCVASGLTIAILVGVFAIPISGHVQSLGIVHRKEEQSVRASVSGFLVSTRTENAALVEPKQVLYRLENSELEVQRSEIQSLVQQLNIQLQTQLNAPGKQSEQIQLQLANARQQLEHIELQIGRLDLSAQNAGEFIPPPESPKKGKFVRQGESLGTICRGPWIVHVMLTADQWSSIEAVRDKPVGITLVGNTQQSLTGRIISGDIAGTKKIEEAALTHSGGGNIAVSQDMLATENFFDVVIEIDSDCVDKLNRPIKVGMSSIVDLQSEPETVGSILLRRGIRLINQIRQSGN